MQLLRKKQKLDPSLTNGSGSGNPYVDAQNVWHERYGSYLAQAYNWRLLAVLEAIALIAAVVGLIYLAGQTKFVPYVVAIDKVGMAFAVHPAERASAIDERVVHAELAQWIIAARSIVTDRIVQLENLNKVYAMTQSDSPARGYLDNYYPQGHDPFSLAARETDEVSVNAILPVPSSQTSYEIQWTELIRDLRGRQRETQTWEATLSISLRAPTDEATILQNPLGIYVTSINWTKKL